MQNGGKAVVDFVVGLGGDEIAGLCDLGVCGEGVDFLFVGAEDVLVAAAKVGVDLAGEECVFGNIGSAGVVVLREHEEPCYADDDAEEGEVGWEFKEPWIAPEGEGARWKEIS